MNTREGLKRVYIIVSLLVCSFVAAIKVYEFPTEESLLSSFEARVKSQVAEDRGVNTWDLPSSTLKTSDFVSGYCKGELSVTTSPDKPDAPIIANKELCSTFEAETKGLWVVQAKHSGTIAAFFGMAAACMLVLYAVLRWVFNGFFPKKSG